jgi:hypothetical protein
MNSPKSCGRAQGSACSGRGGRSRGFQHCGSQHRGWPPAPLRQSAGARAHDRIGAKLPPNATILFLINNLRGSDGSLPTSSSAERAIGTPVLARCRIEQRIAPILALMHAQIWEHGFSAVRTNSGVASTAPATFTKIAESDQPFAVFARGNFRLVYSTKREQLCWVIKTAKGHAGAL